MTDEGQLTQNVLDELSWAPSVNAAQVGVTTSGGVITLTGQVHSFVEKYAAERAALRVKGVTSVINSLDIVLIDPTLHGDEAIKLAAIETMAWDVNVPHKSIEIDVHKGWVTLSGDVEWHYQKECAEQDVRRLSGVFGVSNHVTVRPQVNTANIRDNITQALGRSWFEPSSIQVATDDGKVTLNGTVKSMNDRNEASSIAWAAAGATSVENNIKINA